MKNQLRTGVLLSYINLTIGFIVPFIYTPIMLRMLGRAEYGLYSLAHSAVAYLSLLTFGFGQTIIRYLSKSRAEGKKEEEEVSFGFFLLLYCGMAVLALVLGVIIANNVEPIFHRGLTAEELGKMKVLVNLLAVGTALSFPISVYSSVIVAHERFVYRKTIDMVFTVAAPVANLVALWLGYASVGMVVASTAAQCVQLPIFAVYVYKQLDIRPRFTRLPKGLVGEMVRCSFFLFLGSIVDMLFWSTDKVILGMLAGSVAVAVYNVGGTFNNIIISMSTSLTSVLAPKVTGMVIKNARKEELTELFIRIGRLQYIIIALAVTGFAVFGQAFVRLWAGEEYAGAYMVAMLTMFPLCVPLIQNTGLTILVAQNRHQFRSVVYLIIAVVNVVSTYLCIPKYGYIGAAFCSCVAYILGQGFVMNWYYWKVTGIDIPLFWKTILRMSLIPASMLVLGLVVMRRISISGWAGFFAGVVVYSLIYAFLVYLFVMNSYEKDIFRRPVLKVYQKIVR